MASIDPFTGAESYDPNSAGAGLAIDAMQQSGFEAPLAFRMMEHIPGIGTAAGFSMSRGTNTIMRGGFLDNRSGFPKSRASKFRTMNGGSLSAKNPGQFLGGGRRGLFQKRASNLMGNPGSAGFVKSSRVNNVTARPRALGRFHSLSVFGNESYTPFGASKMLGKSKRVQAHFGSIGINAAEGESVMGPGLFSFVGAGRKADVLERRALKGSPRALKKLQTLDSSITQLAGMNNKAALFNAGKSEVIAKKVPLSTVAEQFGLVDRGAQYVTPGRALLPDVLGPDGKPVMLKNGQAKKGMRIGNKTYGPNQIVGGHGTQITRFEAGAAKPSVFGAGRAAMVTGEGVGTVGVRGNQLASSMYGGGTRHYAGYFRGAQGFAKVGGLTDDALGGAEKAIRHMSEALGREGIVGKGGIRFLGQEGAEQILERGAFKTLGTKGVMKAMGTAVGKKALGARALAMAIPGLNVVATASLVYDLGKMAGEVVKSGINLAKDGVKSMKGTINKPLFGMGYKDTEVAATSRARGVMAIQNSQLNARSALGSEASMMAAHFG